VGPGENLDVANHILRAEAKNKKAAPSPKKAKPVRSSERRSASIERIFTKKKGDEDNSQVKHLKAQLNELKEREQQLRTQATCEVCEFGPPPPPLPPPPPPPASWSKYLTSLDDLGGTPSAEGRRTLGPRLISVSGEDILSLRAGLRKVAGSNPGPAPKIVDTPTETSPAEGLVDSITQRRDAFAPDDSDESDDGSESSEF
jgi:hypothetical protein